ncbi:MAG TPA: hypothetical protein PKD53_15060 [Chloroflexaceae bacterium]|nr:hypothetical protein [Chloroflexaceae bacterium]
MSGASATSKGRQPLSMQTEHARQQQLITLGLLLLLLGPLTLISAGVLAGVVGKQRRRLLACAVAGALLLVGAACFWQRYQELALALWAAGADAYQRIQAGQRTRQTPDYWGLAQQCWQPLWVWWQWSLPVAPFAALNLLATQVRSVEELERERFEREQQAAAAHERRVRAKLDKAPASVNGAMLLGAPLDSGDLPWAQDDFFTYPTDSMSRHAAVIGSSGMGKSETVLRLAAGARQVYGWKVFFIDCKGERPLQERFVATMRAAGTTNIGQFPQRPLCGWQGDTVALLNRLLAVVDYSEPYYRDLTKMLLNLTLEAPGGPPRSSEELLASMILSRLRQRYGNRPEVEEIDGLKPKDASAAYNRYRAFFKALGSGLDGHPGDAAAWSFDTVDAGYILLDGLSLKDQTASFGRFIIEDFAHYAAQRKPAHEKVLLIIDEYPVIAYSSSGTAALFEMVRFHGASIIVTGQSYAGMGEGFDRILGAAETLFLHRCGDPDKLLPRAGQRLAFKRRVGFAERGIGRGAREYATGDGFLAVDEELKIHPNDVKELPPGECFVIAGGRYQRVLVKRAPFAPAGAVVAIATPEPTSSRPLALEVEREERDGHDQTAGEEGQSSNAPANSKAEAPSPASAGSSPQPPTEQAPPKIVSSDGVTPLAPGATSVTGDMPKLSPAAQSASSYPGEDDR